MAFEISKKDFDRIIRDAEITGESYQGDDNEDATSLPFVYPEFEYRFEQFALGLQLSQREFARLLMHLGAEIESGHRFGADGELLREALENWDYEGGSYNITYYFPDIKVHHG